METQRLALRGVARSRASGPRERAVSTALGNGFATVTQPLSRLSQADPSTDSSRPDARAGSHLFPAGQLVPFILVTFLFFLWGIPNNLNDVLIRQFMKSFSISRFQAGLVQSAFYMGYFLLAMPAALLMRKVGYKAGFIIGLLLYTVGAFLFWPAAFMGQYGYFF